MEILGLTIARTKTLLKQAGLTPIDSGWRQWWWPIIEEPTTGAWQRNQEIRPNIILRHPTVYACITLIQEDMGKMRLRLMEKVGGIPQEIQNPAYSPVLRKPNYAQTRQQFIECWINSKLVHGNAYILKQRDNRGVVTALYVMDPTRVHTLVSPDGSIFYELHPHQYPDVDATVILPAREIIHDRISALFNPLAGVSPLFAAAAVATHGLNIQDTSSQFFANGAQIGAAIEVPGSPKQESLDRIKAYVDGQFTGLNAGKILMLADGMKYVPIQPSKANEAQLIEQLNWIDEKICSVFKIPAPKVGVGDQPNYTNIEVLNQQYWSECLQKFAVAIQDLMVEGLGAYPYHIQFDLNDLLRMDTVTKVKAASEGIRAGFLAPNEARAMFFELPPVEGGETPYMQHQDYSLSALARRDSQAAAPSAETETTLEPLKALMQSFQKQQSDVTGKDLLYAVESFVNGYSG